LEAGKVEKRRLPADLVRSFKNVTVGSVGDAVRKLGFKGDMTCQINPIFPVKIAGLAITVMEEPCTDVVSPVHMIEAVDLAGPGDVICIGNGANPEVTLWGGLASAACKARGVEGAVLDGGVRDVEEIIHDYMFPVFSRSTTPVTTVGCYKTVSLNEPTVVGGVKVNPGDIIVGDRDGVVCVPAGLAEKALKMAREFDDMEREQTRCIFETGSMKLGIAKHNRI
jgi:4-hydroxy-4-methyl-2-oxoglutarate aldolase